MAISIEAARNIGSYSLSRLIENKPLDVPVGNFSLLEKGLESSAHVKLPSSLVEEMGLNNLGWLYFMAVPVVSTGFSILYSGVPQYDWVSTSLDTALATIEIARRVNIDRTNKEKGATSDDPVCEPLFVRIGGVIDKRRVVGLTYDCTESPPRLTELNVSFSDAEVPFASVLHRDTMHARDRLAIRLLTSKETPYDTAALLTSAMCVLVINTTHHELPYSALVFQLTPSDILPGRPMDNTHRDTDWDSLKQISRRLGCYARREDGMLVVGLKPSWENTPRWEITVPERLEVK